MSEPIPELTFFETLTPNNRIGLFSFFLAKLSGLAAIPVGLAGWRTFGIFLLILDGLLLSLTVALCIFEMKKQNKADLEDIDVLAQMIKDGTLQEKLRQARTARG